MKIGWSEGMPSHLSLVGNFLNMLLHQKKGNTTPLKTAPSSHGQQTSGKMQDGGRKSLKPSVRIYHRELYPFFPSPAVCLEIRSVSQLDVQHTSLPCLPDEGTGLLGGRTARSGSPPAPRVPYPRVALLAATSRTSRASLFRERNAGLQTNARRAAGSEAGRSQPARHVLRRVCASPHRAQRQDPTRRSHRTGHRAPAAPSPRRPLTRGLPGVDPVGVGQAGDGEDVGGQEEAS